jgi:DNA polymerase-3 subunit delta'
VLGIPASLTSLGACLAAAEHLIAAAKAEADEISAELDAQETATLQTALGVGATGKGVGARGASARGTAGQLKELAERQKKRNTRNTRDYLDRALVDLAAFYRDVLLCHSGCNVPPSHPDFAADVAAVARRVPAPGVLARVEAVLACRTALEQNVKPQIAVEALTAALRLP